MPKEVFTEIFILATVCKKKIKDNLKSINRRMANTMYLHTGMPYSTEEEWDKSICHGMEMALRHIFKWKKKGKC